VCQTSENTKNSQEASTVWLQPFVGTWNQPFLNQTTFLCWESLTCFLSQFFPPETMYPQQVLPLCDKTSENTKKKKHKEPHEINHFSAKQHGWESLTCFSWLFFLKPGANNRFCRCASNLGICNHSAQCKICITFNQNRWIG
jgi:hypothetical protein